MIGVMIAKRNDPMNAPRIRLINRSFILIGKLVIREEQANPHPHEVV